MDYNKVKKELLVSLRGRVSQAQVNKKLGLTFNKMYRWESDATKLSWTDFVGLSSVLKVPLKDYVTECFSFTGDISDSSALVRHFVGSSTIKYLAESLNISRYILSRWMKDGGEPTLEQMFALMDNAAPDFLKFLEILAGGKTLPSFEPEMRLFRAQARYYYAYPWLSILLSALETKGYRKNPTVEYLADKTKVEKDVIAKALPELEESGIVKWNGKHWETVLNRLTVKATLADKIKIVRYVYQTTYNAIDYAPGNENIRLAYKMFSVNKKAYPLILQKFSEVFMDIGKIIDANQDDADGVFLFSSAIIDFDEMKKNVVTPS